MEDEEASWALGTGELGEWIGARPHRGDRGERGGRAVRVKETGTRWGQQSARDEVVTRQIREAILFVCLVLNDSLVQ